MVKKKGNNLKLLCNIKIMDPFILFSSVGLLAMSYAWSKPRGDWLLTPIKITAAAPGNASMMVNYTPALPLWFGATEDPYRLQGSAISRQRVKARMMANSEDPSERRRGAITMVDRNWRSGSNAYGDRHTSGIPTNI